MSRLQFWAVGVALIFFTQILTTRFYIVKENSIAVSVIAMIFYAMVGGGWAFLSKVIHKQLFPERY